MNISKIGLAVALVLGGSHAAQAEVHFQQNAVIVGYELLLDAEDNNPNLFDQGYAQIAHTTVADWGTVTGWLRFENPFDTAENQQGKDGGATTKAWVKLDYNLGETPFNVWFQSFTAANTPCVEQNFYFGGSYDVAFGKLKGTMGLGLQHAFGSFSPTGQSFNGTSGGAAVVMLGYPVDNHWFAKFYYEAQFERSDEHRQTLQYDSYGHQAVVGLDYRVNRHWFVGTSYKHRQSWGGAKNDGGELFFEGGYNF